MTKEMDSERLPLDSLKRDVQNFTDSRTRSSRVATSNCATCYRQKTKCDRQIDGCFNCCKANISCTYPRQEHTTRQKRGPYHKRSSKENLDLEHKVLALETKLKNLSDKMQNGIDLSPGFTANQQRIEAIQPQNKQSFQDKAFVSPDQQQPKEIGCLLKEERGVPRARGEGAFNLALNDPPWMGLKPKFNDIGPLLDDNFTHRMSQTSHQNSQGPFNFLRFSTEISGFHYFHPSPKTILEYWHVYKERVDPMTKILHIPSFEKELYKAIENIQNLSVGMEALMFSIYYTSVSSLPESQFPKSQYENRDSILWKYSDAARHALSNANILMSQDLLVLQALTIYLVGNRQGDPQLEYSLTGIAVRMAQSLGLHKDGNTLQISPFQVEMRRRLWWNIYRLERRFAEDYHLYPFVVEHRFDTRFPSNLDDADICPEDIVFPPAKTGRTEMTYCLVEIEISMLIFEVRDGPRSKALYDKQSLIRECQQRINATHLQYCDTSRDLDNMIIKSANLSLTRIWLSIHQPSALFNSENISNILCSEKTSQNLLQLTLETMEYAQTLPKDPRISKWWWHFPFTIHLHLASYLLVALCHRPQGLLGQRAWKLLDDILEGNEMYVELCEIKDSTSPFSNGLKQLLAQVLDLRDKESRSTKFSTIQRMARERISSSCGRWDSESENTAFMNTCNSRTPVLTPSLSSPRSYSQVTNSNEDFSASNSRRDSQVIGASGLSLMSIPSFPIIDTTQDSHVFGFLTPNDPADLQDFTYTQLQDNSTI